jgi:hypothetical protein
VSNPVWITRKAAVDILKRSKYTVYALAQLGQIRTMVFPGMTYRRFSHADVLKVRQILDATK